MFFTFSTHLEIALGIIHFKIFQIIPEFIISHFSQNTTVKLVDQVIADSDSEVIQKRDEVEDMWKSCLSKRERKTLSSHHCPGYTLGGDNVGKYKLAPIRSSENET